MKRKDTAPQTVVAVEGTPDDFLHTAAGKVGPLLHLAADRVGPVVLSAADRVTPLYTTTAGRVTPLYTSVAGKVTPLVISAAGVVGPYAQSAVGKVGPYAATAKQRGAQVAHETMEKLGPRLEEALEKVSPAVDSAREKVSEDLLLRLTEALGSAATAPVVLEATKRGKATLAAARGDLALPEEAEKKKGGWLKWLAIAAASAGAVAVVARKFLGSQDADWQAARPSAPYAPPSSTPSPAGTDPDVVVADDAPGLVTTDDLAPAGGAELGLGDDVEVGERPTGLNDRTISPSDPITVLADKNKTDHPE